MNDDYRESQKAFRAGFAAGQQAAASEIFKELHNLGFEDLGLFPPEFSLNLQDYISLRAKYLKEQK